ncbi:unnamed protein product [Cylindrotheca closterium]|uniref:G-protein coupled receptors family 1 profile domain-containing protein n=1 Tax=Cylindrotheca closterium TaxID=2856 RepID=A0AAD2PVV4_9STRA|nr:unnamed protein product [Cylindrotheca closterium]
MDSLSTDGEETLSSLTDAQEEVMSICMVISGLLSMFGSTTIVYRVLKKKKDKKPFDRIMLGLSTFDIIGSFSFVLTPFALPAATSPRVWAAGNDASCSFLGYLSQLSIGAAWYSCLLSFYFLATLRLRVSNDDFAVRFEPYIHGLSIFYFLFTATIGVPFHLYRETELGLGCWVTNRVPLDCTRNLDCIGHIVAWFYGGLCLFFTMVALPLNYFFTYCFVRQTLKILARHNPIQAMQVRKLGVQGTLYVLAFFISYGPQLIIRIFAIAYSYERSAEPGIYWLLVLNSICYPLQGFLNMFVYSRPNFLKLREAGMPLFQALRAACFQNDIPKAMEQRTLRVRSSKHYDSSEEITKFLSNVERRASAVSIKKPVRHYEESSLGFLPEVIEVVPNDEESTAEE